ncbi:MAG: glucosaminidase domain-containing protein [Fusobacteriaceae bacterium]
MINLLIKNLKTLKIAIFIFSFITLTTFSESIQKDVQYKNIKAHEIANKNSPSKFMMSLSPIIDNVRNEVTENKKRILELSKKTNHTSEEKKFITKMFSTYKIKYGLYSTLVTRMIVPPNSLILAQASLESNSGASRVAKEANNLFGMRAFKADTPRIKASRSSKVYYRTYSSVRESIMDYVVNYGRNSVYKKLRDSINKGESSLIMVKHLKVYAEDPKYIVKITNIIKKYNLKKYDEKTI